MCEDKITSGAVVRIQYKTRDSMQTLSRPNARGLNENFFLKLRGNDFCQDEPKGQIRRGAHSLPPKVLVSSTL